MQMSSDAAFGAVSLGMFLIYAELCAPGLVVPGSLGAIGVLGGTWVLWQKHLALPGLMLVAASLLFMMAAVRLRAWRVFAVLALLCCCAGSALLRRGPDSISPVLSVPVSGLWAAVTIALGRITWKAHVHKREHHSSRI